MYKLTNAQSILRLSDGASIPNDPDNNDYRDYLEYVKKGGVVAPADVEPYTAIKARVLATYREMREKFLGRIGDLSADAQGKTLPLIVASCGAFRQGLLDLPSCAGVAAATTEAGLKLAIKTEYSRLVALTDPALKAAFWKVDA